MTTTKPWVFDVIEQEDGGFVASCYDHGVFLQDDTLEGVCQAIQTRIDVCFLDDPADKPSSNEVRLCLHPHPSRLDVAAGAKPADESGRGAKPAHTAKPTYTTHSQGGRR
jgi:hypothetical protein